MNVVCVDGVPHFEINESILDEACLVLSRVGDHSADLQPLEMVSIANVSEERRDHFSSGRRAAHIALEQLRTTDIAIGRAGRHPVWPAGIVGSISHSDNLAGAMAGSAETYQGVGLDLISISAVSPKVANRILLDAELNWVQAMGSGDWRTALFSAKESVYKAVNPIVGEYLRFRDVVVRVIPDALEFVASTIEKKESSKLVEQGRGFIHRVEGHWITLFVVRQTLQNN